jgi:large subunit ribosomal protein L18
MANTNKRLLGRLQRKRRIKKRMQPERGVPRMVVYRSNKHIYAQIVDDLNGKVLAASSSRSKDLASKLKANDVEAAKSIGSDLGGKAKALKIERVCFDRNGYRYHGKVKALADGAREAGLNF